MPVSARERHAPVAFSIPDRPAESAHHRGPGEPPSFAALGISPALVEVLEREGIQTPFPVQILCIPDALAGRDVCGKAQTGSGKTLAFGLPLVERVRPARKRHPRALILAPTRELVNQITDRLVPLAEARGIWVTAVYGGVSMLRQINALRAGVEIVVATPGRLNDLLSRDELSLSDVDTVVIDEADQMADMGFLPQVTRILDRIEGHAQTLLFSATLDGAVGVVVRQYQNDPVHHEVAASEATVATLEQRFIGVTAEEKVAVAARLCADAARTIAFVRTTHGADRMVAQMERAGVPAVAIHGRMSQNKRERSLSDFTSGRSAVLVATNVAARGIDISEIDLVIHLDPPEDEKVYLHRSGRTARAGRGGMVVTLVQPEQEHEVLQMERAARLDYPIVRMRADDERLGDLAAWTPPRGLHDVAVSRSPRAASGRPPRSGRGFVGRGRRS